MYSELLIFGFLFNSRNIKLSLKMQILKPVRLKPFYKKFKKQTINLLDIGCGDHSPSLTKKYYPNCIYHGLDRKVYNNTKEDLEKIDRFFP